MPDATSARRALTGVFAANGLLAASWFARIPTASDRVGATPGELGAALLCLGLGAMVSMPFTGRLCARWGSARVTRVGVLVLATAVVLPGFSRDVTALALALAVLGASFGVVDVAMNLQANEVVRALRRPIMPFFHGAFSVGLLAGAAVGALAAGLGIPLPVHLAGAGALAAVLALPARRALLPNVAAGPGETDPGVGNRRLWVRRVGALGALVSLVALAEGAAADWGGLLLRDLRGGSEGAAALGYTVFALTMAVTRLRGESLIERYGPVPVLRTGGLLALAGVLLAVLVPSYAAGVVGLALWGVGVACGFPLVITAAGQLGRGHDAVATVSTLGYAGFLLGPPTIGLLAEHVGLAGALLVVAAALGGVALAAGALAPPLAVPAEPAGAQR